MLHDNWTDDCVLELILLGFMAILNRGINFSTLSMEQKDRTIFSLQYSYEYNVVYSVIISLMWRVIELILCHLENKKCLNKTKVALSPKHINFKSTRDGMKILHMFVFISLKFRHNNPTYTCVYFFIKFLKKIQRGKCEVSILYSLQSAGPKNNLVVST